MDPPKPFPILRLPFLAIEEVFKTMHPNEIINFSMITKRTKGIAKQMSFYSIYSIDLYIRNTPEIRIDGGTKDVVSYVMTSNIEMEGEILEIDGLVRMIFKYSKDPVNEWKLLIKYVLEIFKKQSIGVLKMSMNTFVGQNVSIIDFLKANVKSVDECGLYQWDKEIDVDNHTAFLLDNITIISELNLYLCNNNDDFNAKIPKNLEKLYVESSQWIGYEKLLDIDCKRVILEKNLILDEQWYLFIKKWIAMETNQNLEYLELDYRDFEEFRHQVLHDIPHEVVDGGVKRTFKTRNETEEMSGGIDIRRIDGKTATFFVHREFEVKYFGMSVH
ncbi:hypothetical protein CRE_19513 [Caenorhabditis remanei]|uniref:F-box domain-containing protein n=1 Tax=Caenorhabditis remanei TaxID=31234 RepID=E3NI08_CAERE|nr:hypothetical protein CRE_19513 [Caenorhabditis remanei]